MHGNYFIVPTEQGNEDSLQHSADLAVEEADEFGNLATVHETGIDPNELDNQVKTHACLFLEQICQDSVLLAGQRVKRKLENRIDISDCLDLSDFTPI